MSESDQTKLQRFIYIAIGLLTVAISCTIVAFLFLQKELESTDEVMDKGAKKAQNELHYEI